MEKVNPMHPDKIADRIAGALVDYAYTKQENPRIAVEVLIGHGVCNIVAETSVQIPETTVRAIVHRITNSNTIRVNYGEQPQDSILSSNQEGGIRCGDNGIFKGAVLSKNTIFLSDMAHKLYEKFPTDGKFIRTDDRVIICQSQAKDEEIKAIVDEFVGNRELIINPLGEWTGGTDVDCGATNRKLGSDMAEAVTGGGLHGKDLSKADVSVNIFAHLCAQETNSTVNLACAIGDTEVKGTITNGKKTENISFPYEEVVAKAKQYIDKIGGFEKLAEWGLF